jgi:hypothetical protein
VANFLSPLELEYMDGRQWKITAEFDYHLGAPDGIEYVKIPVGFITDFASIPRAFWNILPPTGQYGKAAVVHDWLYQRRRVAGYTPTNKVAYVRYVERAEADATLNEAMQVLGVGRFTRAIIYGGVRVGGWVPWNSYRSKETS